MPVDPRAGEPAQARDLVNIPRLVTAYFAERPQRPVVFGTSGHRGSPLEGAFNEWHILAITQAICEYRRQNGVGGPLYLGFDTHALSEAAFASALEVLAANEVEVRIAPGGEYTPTPSSSRLRIIRRRMGGSNTTLPTAAPPIARRRVSSNAARMKFSNASWPASGASRSRAPGNRPPRRSTILSPNTPAACAR